MESARRVASWGSETANMQALQTVLERDGQVLRRLAERLATNPMDAEDLLQDTLERAVRQAPRNLHGDALRAWLLRVLRNVFIDHRRAQSVRIHTIERLHEEQKTLVLGSESTSCMWNSIDEANLGLAIEQLDREFRDVLRLSLCLPSQSDIASALGVAKTTVRTRLFRAKRKIRTLLAEARTMTAKTAVSESLHRDTSNRNN